jgi:hypothetical protein
MKTSVLLKNNRSTKKAGTLKAAKTQLIKRVDSLVVYA